MKRLLILIIFALVAYIAWQKHQEATSCGWDRGYQHYTQCIPGTDNPLIKYEKPKEEPDTKAETNKSCEPGSDGEGLCTLPDGTAYHYCDYNTEVSCTKD